MVSSMEERRQRKMSVELKIGIATFVLLQIATIWAMGSRYGALDQRITDLTKSVDHLQLVIEADERARLIAAPTIIVPQVQKPKASLSQSRQLVTQSHP